MFRPSALRPSATLKDEDLDKFCYFDVSSGEKSLGRIVFGLAKKTPKTAENFYQLCKSTSVDIGGQPETLSYARSIFHRIIPGFMIQGGDITEGNGRGGYSIYGRAFKDEGFPYDHDVKYLLSMANRGPNTNSSQFFITTSLPNHLDGKHVVFGKVISGEPVVDALEKYGTSGGSPTARVFISSCGVLDKDSDEVTKILKHRETEREKAASNRNR